MNNDLKPIQTIAPFKKFCMTIGELPSSYLETMSYYEMLVWFTKFLQETVIPAINNNGEAVNELQTKYIELKSYVDNYLDNLDVQDEINNKLDDMVETGEFQEILEEYIATKVDYFYIDENSTFSDIKNAFESPKAKVIEFKNGTYTLSNRIYLTSNTTVYLNNATLNSSYTDPYGDNLVFLGYSLDSTYTGYNGRSNIKFLNGKINTGFALMHNTNIEFNNITFDNITGHAIQIGGCKNIKILNCVFKGTIIDDEHGNTHELIQLERSTYGGQPYQDESNVTYDNTTNFNIEINNCLFDVGNEVTTRNYVCIGHHSFDDSYPIVNTNIQIKNCTFKDSVYGNISGGNFYNIQIENNSFEQLSERAEHIHIRLRAFNYYVYIKNNVISGGRIAIYNVNVKQNEFWYIENNEIVLTGGVQGIGINDVDTCYITNNKIKNDGKIINIYDTGASNNLKDIFIKNNYFDMTTVTPGNYGINLLGGNNIYIENNEVIENSNVYLIWINGSTDYFIKDNYIKTTQTVPAYVSGTNVVYNNIYGLDVSVYSGTATSYSLTNQTPTKSLDNFNTLSLLLHKTNDGTQMAKVKIHPYSYYAKFSDRKYGIPVVIDNAVEYCTFEIASGKINFSSSDNKVVLRQAIASNEYMN